MGVTPSGHERILVTKGFEAIFFEDGDHDVYRDLLAEQTKKAQVEVWAYCFMPNHVHLVLTPKREDGLGQAVGGRIDATQTLSMLADAIVRRSTRRRPAAKIQG